MEMMRTGQACLTKVRSGLLTGIFLLFFTLTAWAQMSPATYGFKNGKMQIQVSKSIKPAELDSFITRFGLADLPLKEFLKSGAVVTWQKLGWLLEKNTSQEFIISKSLGSSDNFAQPGGHIVFSEKGAGSALSFPAVSSRVLFGNNRFRSGTPFLVKDSVVTFVFRQKPNANRVTLAGSFNNWNPRALAMTKTPDGWTANVKLAPGKYWYKFIVDGDWTTDPDNLAKENDGRGNTNSVYFKPNTVFRLAGYQESKRVYLAGSFNNWRTRDLLLQKTATGWALPLYLANGTHTYRFIADGDWLTDPGNPNKLPNEFGEFNSVIRLGKPTVFKLEGYQTARQVVLTGSFNNWREDELFLSKTATGWEIPYTLGPGNYQYKFKVDKKFISDPGNPLVAPGNGRSNNSFLIVSPNYTFRLKGYSQAKNVYLAGDFNDWSPNALPMMKDKDGWYFNVHLPPGKTRYKFVVDDNWIKDPGNTLWEQNEFGTGNSVIWRER